MSYAVDWLVFSNKVCIELIQLTLECYSTVSEPQALLVLLCDILQSLQHVPRIFSIIWFKIPASVLLFYTGWFLTFCIR